MSFIYLEKRKLNNKIVPFNANRFIVSKFSGLWRLVSWQNERFKREVYSNTMTLPPPISFSNILSSVLWGIFQSLVSSS